MSGGMGLFARSFDAVAAPASLRRFVLDELASPRRHWHGLLHHALMLRAIGKAGHGAGAQRRLTLAVLFHDIVYDAQRGDNEEASAVVARRWLAGDEADAGAALILATKHHGLTAADPVTRTLLEADLAVLWTPSERLYRFYANGIRREYAHVPDAAYRSGRGAVLRRLEDQLRTSLDAAQTEALARNLGWERTALSAGAFDLNG